MASIGDLVISLRADIASFRSSMNQANQSLDDVKKHVSDCSSAMADLQKYFEGLASIEGARKLVEFAAGLVETAAQIKHVTEALGVNAAQFQEQQFAFREAGVDAGVFSSSMEKLSKNIDLVASGEGGKKLVEVFSRLGLSATNFDGTIRSTSDLLDDLAHDKIFQAEEETRKLGDYMLLTGARGGEAALGVNALGASFDKSKADAIAFNQVLSQDTIDTLTRVKEQFETGATAVKNFFATLLAESFKANNGPNLYTLTDGLLGVAPGESAPNLPKSPTADKPPGPPVTPGSGAQGKQLQSFNTDYAKLIANYRQDLDYQQQLRTAYTAGAAAVRQLQVDHAGELAVYKVLDEAELKHVQVSDQMLESVRKAAEANEQAKLAASEQKTITDALTASVKRQDEAMRALVESADALTPKEQKLADTEGLLIQAFNRGLISADQFNQKMKELQDAANTNTGFKDLTSGLSTDLSSLIGKMTDFSTLIANKQKGESIFQQFSQDAADFTKSLQELLLKLLVINPLLNAIGLGDQGGGKLLPALIGPGAAPSLPGFKDGGQFVVGGGGGVDSSLVAFKATPGEKVSVGLNADRGAAPVQHNYYMPITVVTPDANSFLKTQEQIVGDGIRAIKKHAGRYA